MHVSTVLWNCCFKVITVCVYDVTVDASYDPIRGEDTCTNGIVCYNNGHCYSDDGVTYGCRCQIGFNGTNCQYG